MRYLDEATDRLERRYSSEFDTMVESVRVGYLTAVDGKALARWRNMQGRRRGASSGGAGGAGLTGAALERTIMSLAISHPDLVQVRAAA